MTSSTSAIADFYCASGTDHRGRSFDDILRFDDAELERTHDYIQWLFPTVTASRFNPDAPTLDAATATRLRTDPTAQRRLRAALLRMLAFYGLELDNDDPTDPEIFECSDFSGRARQWLTPGNHNYSRLTRMLASLIVLDQRPLALALYRCLERLYRTDYGAHIGDTTLSHWRRHVD